VKPKSNKEEKQRDKNINEMEKWNEKAYDGG